MSVDPSGSLSFEIRPRASWTGGGGVGSRRLTGEWKEERRERSVMRFGREEEELSWEKKYRVVGSLKLEAQVVLCILGGIRSGLDLLLSILRQAEV